MVTYPYGYSKDGGPGPSVPLATIQASPSWRQLHPEMQRRTEAILVASGGRLGFGQGWRDPKQADLEFVRRHHLVPAGTPAAIWYQGKWWALSTGFAPLAPSDRSYHCPTPLPQDDTNAAMAVDFVGDMAWFDSHCALYGFVNGISGEIWHGQPVEFPHARSTFNADPVRYPLKTWPLTDTAQPIHPPQGDDDMALLIQPNDGDPAVFSVAGTLATWVHDPAALDVAKLLGTVSSTVKPVARQTLKAFTLVGSVPVYGTPPGRATVAGDFAEVVA